MKRNGCVAILLIAGFLLLSGCGGHKLGKPALDISDAAYASFDEDWNIVVGGITYEDSVPYVPVQDSVNSAGVASVKDLRGRVIAYFINNDRYVFFCEAENLDPSEWLIRIPDNGRGSLQWEDAYWIKAEDVPSIPSWLEERNPSQ